MKEDFCIMRFLKKQYQGKNFVAHDKEGQDGKLAVEIPPQRLEQLKEEYFQNIIQDIKRSGVEMSELSMYDKIIEVGKVAKDIYKDILENSQGLTVNGGKIQAYQFDQDLFISPNMMGEDAVQQAKEAANASGTATRITNAAKQ